MGLWVGPVGVSVLERRVNTMELAYLIILEELLSGRY